ncbi:MAG: hypothetical protein EKK46_12245 [Rhodocyclaceae bacterium]|nr:MAG: hypothetical protein EKK46_12245 [Rhodocyclaceae bacterium]
MTQPRSSLPLLLARMRHAGMRLGWPAALGVVLILSAIAVDWDNQDVEQELERLRGVQAELQHRLANRAEGNESTRHLADLADVDSLSPVVSALHDAARKNGVALDQGDYRLQPEAGTRLSRYRIDFPARGAFPQLYAWLAEAIAAQPGLVLEGLDLKRDNVGGERLDSNVRLVLLVRSR